MINSIILPSQKSEIGTSEINVLSSVVIVGANGTGKSRLGYWIEMNQPKDIIVHRIAAQRSLEMPIEVFSENYEEAVNALLFGTVSKAQLRKRKKNPKIGRWGDEPVTKLLYDIDELLALLFAEENRRNREVIERLKKDKNAGSNSRIDMKESKLDILKSIWYKLLPHRELVIKEKSIETIYNSQNSYAASLMSDGERVIFYLIGHCLCAPKNSIIIIDEPEIHIHRAIQDKLWNELELIRNDCLFIYLTHDLNFAASRINATQICLREYDGKTWDWFESPRDSGIPDSILFELLGSREPILLIEGENGSLDQIIYSQVYPDFKIKPVGSCGQVIGMTKSFNKLKDFHHLKAFGIIDRDYRDEKALENMKYDHIHTLDVAEIENLFLLEKVLKIVAEQLHVTDPEKTVIDIKKFVCDRFENSKEEYASNKVSRKIRDELQQYKQSSKKPNELKEELNQILQKIDVDQLYSKAIKHANKLIDSEAYDEILLFFNQKGLVKEVGRFFKIKPSSYIERVKNIIHSGGTDILDEIKKKLPSINYVN